MTWTYILLGLVALGIVRYVYAIRKLTIADLIELLSMSSLKRLAFANNRRFQVEEGGSNIPSMNSLKRYPWFGNDRLVFPHDNAEIVEWNERHLFSLAAQGH